MKENKINWKIHSIEQEKHKHAQKRREQYEKRSLESKREQLYEDKNGEYGTVGNNEQWIEHAEILKRTRNKKWRKLRKNSESEKENEYVESD